MRQLLLLTVALLAVAGTGLNCHKDGDYTVLVDRQDSMYVTPGSYTGFRSGLEAGDKIKAEFNVLDNGGPIDLLVFSEADLALWESGQQYEAVIEVSNSSGGTETGTIATTGDYWILASNKDDSTAAREVFYEVWRKDR